MPSDFSVNLKQICINTGFGRIPLKIMKMCSLKMGNPNEMACLVALSATEHRCFFQFHTVQSYDSVIPSIADT